MNDQKEEQEQYKPVEIPPSPHDMFKQAEARLGDIDREVEELKSVKKRADQRIQKLNEERELYARIAKARNKQNRGPGFKPKVAPVAPVAQVKAEPAKPAPTPVAEPVHVEANQNLVHSRS